MKEFRRKYYKISAWLGLYFPVRFAICCGAGLYPRPYSAVVLEVIILAVYMGTALCVNLAIDKKELI